MRNWHLNSFPHDLLNGLIWHIEGVGRTGNIKSVIDLVESGCDDGVKVTFETFVVSGKTICASCLNNLIG